MKLKTKIVALASTALLFAGAAFGVGITLNNANAEEWTATATEWQWEEKYAFGSTLDVPAYTVTVGGETIAANAIVTLPNGSTTTEAALALNQAGVYTVSYYANKDGKEYAKILGVDGAVDTFEPIEEGAWRWLRKTDAPTDSMRMEMLLVGEPTFTMVYRA